MPTATPTPPRPVIAAYLPDYNTGALKAGVLADLTDLIYFSIEPTPDGGLALGAMSQSTLDELARYKQQHGLRLLLAVGGWGRSDAFGPMALNDDARRRFAQNVTQYARQNGFDGVDFDWEHPKNADEEAAYARLIADTKRAAQPLGLIVTAAMAGWQRMPREGFDALDRLHLMSYDRPGRHSTLDGAREDVEQMVAQGVSPAKIALGVPLYGRGIEDRIRERPYWLIVVDADPPPDVDEVSGMYFNNLDTARRKAEYARDRGLAGVMAWEATQDMPGDKSLLAAMRRVLRP